MIDNERRFSLDPIKVDPLFPNRIFSAYGDDTVDEWNGEDITDLVKELDPIEEKIDANYNSLPHSDNIPEDLRGAIEKDCSIWTCGINGNCLTDSKELQLNQQSNSRKLHFKIWKSGSI